MTHAYLGTSGIVLLGDTQEKETDSDGVEWRWSGSSPWDHGPAPRTVTGENANDHGSWDATAYYEARDYPLEGKASAPDHDTLHAARQRFMTAVNIRGFDLRCVEPGADRVGRFRRDGKVLWTELTDTLAQFSAPLWAGDPRGYSTATKTGSTAFPSTTGGMTWPATWPAAWTAVVSSGLMQLVNDGNDIAWPTWRIDGPVVNPSIVNVDTGEAMNFDITLAAGEWLTIDTRSHQVLANGDPGATRRTTFYGTWWGLEPGSNTVRFLGESGTSAARLSYAFKDTWI
jgi:hypothetical protein